MARGVAGSGPYSKIRKDKKDKRKHKDKTGAGRTIDRSSLEEVLHPTVERTRKVAPHSSEGRTNIATAKILIREATKLLETIA